MATFGYPTSAQLEQIAQVKMPNLMANRKLFDLMPVRNVDSHVLLWEQLDNFIGLQQIRGLDGEPARVQKVGLKRYIMQPGVYGEYVNIDEQELTTRRGIGTFGDPIDISDLVTLGQDQLLGRRLDRMELIGWSLLTTGTFSVPGPNGAIMQTDTFPLQTFTAGVTWATAATSTPLNDFRTVQLRHRGYSVRFDASSTAYMNRLTWNNLINNSNNADLYGRRTQGLGIVNNVGDFNSLLMRDDLPSVVIYDEGYLDATGTFQPFIPNNKVVLVGKRPAGQVIGEIRCTRNANNPNMAAGPYTRVIDQGEHKVPRAIQVHDGVNFGPVVYFPSAIIIMNV